MSAKTIAPIVKPLEASLRSSGNCGRLRAMVPDTMAKSAESNAPTSPKMGMMMGVWSPKNPNGIQAKERTQRGIEKIAET